jgi:hypothetical protein
VKLVDRTDDVSCDCSQHLIPPEVETSCLATSYNISIQPSVARRNGREWIPACARTTNTQAGVTDRAGVRARYFFAIMDMMACRTVLTMTPEESLR